MLPRQLLADHRRQCVGLTKSRSRVEALIQPLVVRRQAKINGCTRFRSITASSRSQSYGAVDIPSHTRGSSIVLTWQQASSLALDRSFGRRVERSTIIHRSDKNNCWWLRCIDAAQESKILSPKDHCASSFAALAQVVSGCWNCSYAAIASAAYISDGPPPM